MATAARSRTPGRHAHPKVVKPDLRGSIYKSMVAEYTDISECHAFYSGVKPGLANVLVGRELVLVGLRGYLKVAV